MFWKYPWRAQASRFFLVLPYGNQARFNWNPSMRAVAKTFASTHLIFASNSSKGQILRALEWDLLTPLKLV